MKLLTTILLLIISVFGYGQDTGSNIFFNPNKSLYHEADIVLIPSTIFSYSLRQIEFLENNTPYKPRTPELRPELYLGVDMLSNGFSIGAYWGVLQNSIALKGGVVIPISVGAKKKK